MDSKFLYRQPFASHRPTYMIVGIALCRTSIELIDLVISEAILPLPNCSLLVETASNKIIDAISLTEYFSVKRNVETLFRNFASDIRAGHRSKLLKFKDKPWIKNLRHVRCQHPDWWEPETSDVLCIPNPIGDSRGTSVTYYVSPTCCPTYAANIAVSSKRERYPMWTDCGQCRS